MLGVSSEHDKTLAQRLSLYVRTVYTTAACAYGMQTLALCCLRLFVHPVLARTTSSVSTLRRTGGMFRPLARVIASSTASAARREGEGSIDVSASARRSECGIIATDDEYVAPGDQAIFQECEDSAVRTLVVVTHQGIHSGG